MASVTSLDHDMRKLRLDRYTPQAANEIRTWIETVLGEPLAQGDLLDVLKDGVALCKLANLAVPSPGIRFKTSTMPFTQRENISQFLRACEQPPLNMPSHDRFLTVDLYDNKDPAQVIQCLGAFSRAANAVNPSRFRTVIGPKRSASPTKRFSNGNSSGDLTSGLNRARGVSNASQTSDSYKYISPSATGSSSVSRNVSTTASVSSWSKRSDEAVTAPAWNIHQYGYMGGASQGNQGVSFGSRRQITSAGPEVPSLAEKQKRRREQEEEMANRSRVEAEDAARQQRAQQEAESRARAEEEQRWEEEARKARERERLQVEQERQRWEEQERQWKEDEEKHRQEEAQSRAVHTQLDQQQSTPVQQSESQRIRDLEQQLEEAKERERQYQLERGQRKRDPAPVDPSSNEPSTPTPSSSSLQNTESRPDPRRDSWAADERDFLRKQWSATQSSSSPRPLPDPATDAIPSPRPLPQPTSLPKQTPQPFAPLQAEVSALPPQTAAGSSTPETQTQTPPPKPQRPLPSPAAYGRSLLEREMERERERQREWEETQMKRQDGGGGGGNSAGARVLGPRQMR